MAIRHKNELQINRSEDLHPESPWWDQFKPQFDRFEWFHEDELVRAFSAVALHSNRRVFSLKRAVPNGQFEEFNEFLSSNRFRAVVDATGPDDNSHKAYVRHDGAVCIGKRYGEYFWQSTTHSEEFFGEAKTFLERLLGDLDDGPPIWILRAPERGPLRLEKLGTIRSEWIPENYTPKISAAYVRVVHELSQPQPAGRFLLLDGEPGTGKTHYLRSVIANARDANFVIIPPSLTSSLTGPTLIGVLKDFANRGKPIVLVLEDADQCLAPRQSDNMNLISALLNLTDGIVGAILDVRIVASTNQKLDEIDAALLRPGSLLGRLRFEPLCHGRAAQAMHRLTPHLPAKLEDRAHTLAEIYALANGAESELLQSEKPLPIGFSL